MNDEIKRDILSILMETIRACEEGNYVGLKEISNHTIHNASIFQDKDSISIAVIIYSIYKISSRTEGNSKAFCGQIMRLMKDAYELLKRDDLEGYENAVKKIFESISTFDVKLGAYIQEVIDQSQIKKGSMVYEHGISMARAAEILGVSEWELMSYVGKKRIPEIEEEAFDIKSRMAFSRNLFGV